MIRILYIVLVVLVLFLITLCIISLLQILRNYARKHEDGTFNFEREIYNITETILTTGKMYTDVSHNSRAPTTKTVTVGSLWEIGLSFLHKNLNPVKKAKKRLEPEIRETLSVLQEAKDNALKHGSREAIGYVDECVREIEAIFSGLKDAESITRVRKKIEEIKSGAREIADADSFNDEDSYDSETKDTDDTWTKKEEKNYYEILCMEKDATPEEIKRAYRELAKKYHPDKYSHLADDLRDEAEKRFREINNAYEVLSDYEKRKQYNNTIS